MKLCVICDDPAVFFCLADEAFICGDCDEQIHGVNMLARRHRRVEVASMGLMSSLRGQRCSTGRIVVSPSSESQGSSSFGIGRDVAVAEAPQSAGGFAPVTGLSLEEALARRDAWRKENVTNRTWSALVSDPEERDWRVGVNLSSEKGMKDDSTICVPNQVMEGDPIRDLDWPRVGSITVVKEAKRRMTLAPPILEGSHHARSEYKPTMAGGKRRASLQLAEDIHQQLFSSDGKGASQLEEVCQSDHSMGGVAQVLPECSSLLEQGSTGGDQTEDEDDRTNGIRFSHSWVPVGPGPSLGWYWIPKGALLMKTYYPAQANEVRRFGYLAKHIRRLPPPTPLTHSFARTAMANRGPNRPMKRRQEDWRQEAWMEEDDLLAEEFRQEKDL